MSSETDPLAWIAYAEDDYEITRIAMRRKRPITHAACFHAQLRCYPAMQPVSAILATNRSSKKPKTPSPPLRGPALCT